jgi:Cell wall-active antibiotics response 4TMS YvqF
VLDLREARVTGPEMRIEAGTVFGDVDLIVPEGVEVEARSRTVFGDTEQEAGEAAPRHAPRIVLSGGSVFGDVRVRTERLRAPAAARVLTPGQTGPTNVWRTREASQTSAAARATSVPFSHGPVSGRAMEITTDKRMKNKTSWSARRSSLAIVAAYRGRETTSADGPDGPSA